MFGILQSKNDDKYEPRDTLAVFKENGTAEIVPVVSINDERLLAGPYTGGEQYAIPLQDLKSFTGPEGRIFLWPTSVENVTDCQRIAALERSTVLRQITHFDQETAIEEKKPISKALIFGGLAVLVLIIIMVAN